MRTLPRLVVLSVLLALLLTPLMASADQLPAFYRTRIDPGVTTINYAGQSFRFSTPTALYIKFRPISVDEFRMTVKMDSSMPPGGSGASSMGEMTIYWVDFSDELYEGSPPPPSSPFEILVNKESGFTEK